MKKNNDKFGFLGFGMLIGVWISTFISYYTTSSNLIVLSIFCGGVSFLGFIHYYTKDNNKPKSSSDKKDKENKSLLEKAKVWDN